TAYCPIDLRASDSMIAEYASAARENDVVIAEVGAWSNLLSPSAAEREDALKLCVQALVVADKLGARCCVNVAGSRGTFWCGHHPTNHTTEVFNELVRVIEMIVDEADPQEAVFALETSPWNYPYDVESYKEILRAVDRKAFRVHFDLVNLINDPHKY